MPWLSDSPNATFCWMRVADHHVLLASVHLGMGDATGATRLLERATELAPESEPAHRALAAAYAAQGRDEEAMRAVDKAEAIAHGPTVVCSRSPGESYP